MDEHFRVGDAVTLRTGGPVMTVQALSMSLAYCAWSAGGKTHHGTFEVASLSFADPAAGLRAGSDTRQDDCGRAAG